jgi:hypothetical protein
MAEAEKTESSSCCSSKTDVGDCLAFAQWNKYAPLSPLTHSNCYVARAWEFEKRRGDAIRLTDGCSEQTDRELVSSSHEFDAVEREESAEMIGSSPGDENRAVDKVIQRERLVDKIPRDKRGELCYLRAVGEEQVDDGS